MTVAVLVTCNPASVSVDVPHNERHGISRRLAMNPMPAPSHRHNRVDGEQLPYPFQMSRSNVIAVAASNEERIAAVNEAGRVEACYVSQRCFDCGDVPKPIQHTQM